MVQKVILILLTLIVIGTANAWVEHTHAYTFNGTVNNSAKKDTGGTSTPAAPNAATWVAYTAPQLKNITNNDAKRNIWSSDANDYVNLMYAFKINQSVLTIRRMKLTWIGYDALTDGGSFTLWIGSWFFSAFYPGWVSWASDSTGRSSDQTYTTTYGYGTSFGTYVNGSNWVYLAASGDYDSGGSCPFVYSYNGSSYTFDHEAYPYAVAKVGEITTYETLKHLKPINNTLKLQLREELPEYSYTDFIEIYSVEHPNNNSSLMIDWNGKPHTIQNYIKPKCIDKDGKDCSLLVENLDNLIWTSDLDKDFTKEENYYDWIELEWDKPKDAKQIKIGMNVMKTQAITWAWQYWIDNVGQNNFPLMEKLVTESPALRDAWLRSVRTNWRLNAELWDGNQWISIDSIEAGRERWADFLLVTNISNITWKKEECSEKNILVQSCIPVTNSKGDFIESCSEPYNMSILEDCKLVDKIRIRLKATSGFYDVNRIFADFSEDEEMVVHNLPLMTAIKNNKQDVKSLLKRDRVYLNMTDLTNDVVNLEYFDYPSSSWKKEYYVAVKGYYHFREFTEYQSLWKFVKTTLEITLPVLYEDGFEAYYFMNKYSKKHNSIYENFVKINITENRLPTQTVPLITSTSSYNLSSDNITCWNRSTSDADKDRVTNIYNWKRNGTSITILNMPMERNTTALNVLDYVSDYSGYYNFGVNTQGAAAANVANWTENCKVGGCYKFGGTGGINVSDVNWYRTKKQLNFSNIKNFTIEFWFKKSSAPDLWAGMVLRWVTTANAQFYVGWNTSGNQVWFMIHDGTNNYDSIAPGIMANNKWYMVTAVYNRTHVALFINGTLKNATKLASPVTIGNIKNNVSLQIGRLAGSSFKGWIDEVKIYNFSISRIQIEQNYKDSLVGKSSNRTIVDKEIRLRNNWTCEITPNDAFIDGILFNSSVLINDECDCKVITERGIDCSENCIFTAPCNFYAKNKKLYGTGTVTYRSVFYNFRNETEPSTCTIYETSESVFHYRS